MRRPRLNLAALLVALILAAGPLLLPRPVEARQGDAPRVAVIVGPVGSFTAEYRRIAREAAVEARRWTPDVVTVFSPYATWPAVRAAINGASIVIYLGHGNGWPSPHRSALYDRSQNGFGLNSTEGDGDYSHQYFGADYLRREVDLAPGAVVIFHRLCYASGNSEPGVPEGTPAMARQRVDNYAAGFLDVGAGAVIADAFAHPAGYVRRLLGSGAPPITAWRKAPTANGHTFSFESVRTKGALAFMDPDNESSGFYRSIVLSPAAARTSGPAGVGTGEGTAVPAALAPVIVKPTTPLPPSLAAMGVTSGLPVFSERPAAATTTTLTVPLALPPGTRLPAGLQVGTRWTPIDVAPPASGSPSAAGGAGVAGASAPAASPAPAAPAGAGPTPPAAPAATPGPATSAAPSPSPATTPRPGTATRPGDATSGVEPGTRSGRPGAAAAPTSPAPTPPAPAQVDPTATPEPSSSLQPSPTPAPGASSSPDPGAGASPGPSGSPEPTASPAPTVAPANLPPAEETLGTIDQVVPEAASVAVDVVPAVVTSGGLRLQVGLPRSPGRYRLVVSLHGPDGVALDAETQALIPAMLVRVAGPLEVTYKAPASVRTVPGSEMRLLVTVANSGTLGWRAPAETPATDAGKRRIDGRAPAGGRPVLVGRWLPLDSLGSVAGSLAAEARFDAAPGKSAKVVLSLRAPETPGSYLVVLDVRSPVHGSLAVRGASPATVVVIVAEP